jgi:hypothetical protein
MAGWSVPGVMRPREVGEDPVGRRVVARHRITQKSLAITYLSPELLADTEFRSRFGREFARLARVRDSRVARVHRYLESDHGAAVIGDHVNGASLRTLLLAHGAVSIEAALVVLKDSLRALGACHEVGVAHGHMKPEDVVLTAAGQVRLVDFGLWTSDGRRLRGRSTPFYLAPEQWSDRPATPAGDAYAATVTFFECLVGAPPFYADGAAELSAKHERGVAPVEVLPESVRELVLCGLAKEPGSRSDAGRLLAHLGEVAARAVGSDWEQCGRRELTTLLSGRSAVPDGSALGRRSGGWANRKPVRLAAVMGGALALAAGLSSPPLAVIVPGMSMFDPGGRSPVLAFPEPDQDAVPVRVVTNGPLANRALIPAARAGTTGPVARARPPAPSIPAPRIEPAPYAHAIPDALHEGSAQHAADSQSAPSAMDSEHPTTGAVGTTWDPLQGPIPVAMPVQLPVPVQLPGPVQLPVPVQLPAPVQLPVPVQVAKSIPVRTKTQLLHDTRAPKGTHVQTDSQGWKRAPSGPANASKTDPSTSRPQGNLQDSGYDSRSSGHNSGDWGQQSGHSGNRGR